MSDKKIIAVVGATGAQGGGLVRAILNDARGEFAVRAITRDPTTDKAKGLKELGAEVVAADVADVASLEAAFRGAWGAFCVTFFWEHFSPETELAHAANLAEAARRARVRHVIWSTLEDTRRLVPLSDPRMPTLMGKYKVPHFDSKGEANLVFLEKDVPTTFLVTSFYWDNFVHFGMGPKRDDAGRLVLTLPMGDKRLPGIAAEDIGKCALGVFRRSDLIGQHVGIAGEFLTGAQMAAELSRALGEEVRYHAIEPEAYRRLGFPGAEDLGNMFQFKRDFEAVFCGARNLELTRSLNPELLTFGGWLAQNAKRIPLE